DETITAIIDPSIAIVKSASVESEDDCYDTDDVVTYTFMVTNTGNVTLENVVIDETYHFTGTGTLGAVMYVSSSMSSSEGTLLPNETATYTAEYVITQEDTDTRFINNQAEVTATYGDGMTVDDLSGDSIDTDNETQVDLCQQPSIAIVKSASVDSEDECYDTDDVVTYTFMVTNTGNVTLENVVIDETYHFTGTGTLGTVMYVSSSMSSSEGTLLPNETATYTAEYVITQEDTDIRFINNQAEVTATYGDGMTVDDLSGDSVDTDNETQVDLCQDPSLDLTKTLISNDDELGGELSYEIKVENTGNVTLYDIYVEDETTGDNWTIAELAPKGVETFTVDVEITQELLDDECYENTAFAEAREYFDEQSEPGTENPILEYIVIARDVDSVVECFTQTPELEIAKSILSGDPYSLVGNVVEYQYIITNTGNVTLDGPFTVSDDKVPGIPAAAETELAPNETITLTASYTVVQEDLTNGSVTNIATATGYFGEDEVVSEPDQATAEALFNEIIANDDDAGTYTIAGGVATINAFDNDSYMGGAANPGNVTLTTVIADPEGVLTVDANGEIAIAANATAGTYQLTYRITEIGNTANYDEAIITAVVEPVLIIDEIESYCELDAPYLRWLLEPANFNLQDLAPGDPNPLTMIWYNSNDEEIIRFENIPMEGYMLFPGADTLPGGYGSQWPGWRFVNEQWESGDFNFAAVREPGAYVLFQLNPEVSSEIAYPGATAACNPNPNPPIAVDDDMTSIPVYSQFGFTDIVNVLDNDKLGALTGLNTTLVDITLVSESTPGALILDTNTGLVSVATGLAPGIYTLEYRICTNPNPTNCDTAVVTVLVVQPLIQVTKTVVSNDDQLGGFITYNINVTNNGTVDLSDVEVKDDLTGNTWNIPTLAQGASVNFSAQLEITQDVIEGECVTNTASATVYLPQDGEGQSTVLAEDTDSVVECVTLSPAIDIVKEANPTSVDLAGDIINYALTVTNTGNVILNNVTVSDPLTDLLQNLGTMAPGEVRTIETSYTVTQENMDSGSILNIASVTGTSNKEVTVTDQDDATVEAVRNPSIDLNKTVDLESVSREGIVLNYTLEVTNTGNVTLSSGNLVDPKTGLSLPNITLAPGEMKSFSTTYTVTLEDILSGQPILNVATVNAVDALSGTPVQAQSQATVNIQYDPAIDIVKTADKSEITAIGEEITYTLTVTNTGNAPLLNVVVSDPMLNFEEQINLFLPGQVKEYTITYTVTEEDVVDESVVNVANVTGTAPNEVIVSDQDSVAVLISIEDEPDPVPGISLIKEADVTTVSEIGQVITFTLTVTNTGEENLVNVNIVDGMINVDETIDLLAVGETVTVTGTYTVTAEDLEANTSFFNFATASGDGEISGEGVSETSFVEIGVSYNPIIANDDDFGTYFLSYGGRLGNILDNDRLNGVRPDDADVDFEFTELDGIIGLIIDENGELSLIPGVNEAREYTLKYTLREVVNPSNSDDAFVVFRLQNDQVDLSVTKTSFEAEIFEGDEFEYEIVITNGDTPATNVIVTDNLPAGVTYLSNTVTVNNTNATVNANVTGSAITWTIPAMAPEASITIRVKVKAGAAGTVTNTVIVGSDEDDTDESNNQDDDVNTILPFHIPNVITPNNDGDNDTFEIQGLGKFVSNEITIFNRYGDHVLEQENYKNDWNAPGQVAGTYFYVMTAVDSSGRTHEFKGWIQVIKD
ncbi:DUF11 domain-containing protein, partial [Algoriphagus aestuarii]|nr:DUF11 domain-containing protein [Algoriphagus aestuarii]